MCLPSSIGRVTIVVWHCFYSVRFRKPVTTTSILHANVRVWVDHTACNDVVEKRICFPIGYLSRYDFVHIVQVDLLRQPYQDVYVWQALFLPLDGCTVCYLVSKYAVFQQQLLQFGDLQAKDPRNQIWPFMCLLAGCQLTLNLLPAERVIDSSVGKPFYDDTFVS